MEDSDFALLSCVVSEADVWPAKFSYALEKFESLFQNQNATTLENEQRNFLR